MGDTLFGGVESGTPIETRAGTQDLASLYRGLLAGNDGGLTQFMAPFQRLGQQSFRNLYGVGTGEAGIPEVIQSILTNPADRTRGLFAAMRPFENRTTNEAVAGTRSLYGTAGGRFSRNLAEGESRVRGELANQFALTREQGLMSAQAQQANFLAQLFQLANQNAQTGMQGLGFANQFLQPGAPIQKQGILPGLLAAAGNIFAAKAFGGGQPGMPGQGWVPRQPTPLPQPSDPFGPGGPYYNG